MSQLQGFLNWSAGASSWPPEEGESRSSLASSRRLCPGPGQAEATAGGLRPADTRQYLGGEATSLSVPPHRSLSYGLTRNCNRSSPSSNAQKNIYMHNKHEFINKHAETNYQLLQSRIQIVMAVSLPSPVCLSPSSFLLFWQPMKFFCLQPTFNCPFIQHGLIVLSAGSVWNHSVCTFCITIGAIDWTTHPAVRVQVPFSETVFHLFMHALIVFQKSIN